MDNSNTAKQAIENLVAGLRAAWNQHDAQAFAINFAEDADFTNVFGIHIQGRGAIERSHAVIFRTMFRDSRWTDTVTSIRLLRPDIASVDIRWQMTGARDAQGKEWPKRHGLIGAIAAEASEGWAFVVFHNQDLPSPERVAEITKLLAV